MNENQKVFCVNVERRQCTPFFKFKSSNINLLSCLVYFLDKNGRFSVMIGQIACQSNSMRRVNSAMYRMVRSILYRTIYMQGSFIMKY